jgi:uncharacterized protein (TIGR02145 family)
LKISRIILHILLILKILVGILPKPVGMYCTRPSNSSFNNNGKPMKNKHPILPRTCETHFQDFQDISCKSWFRQWTINHRGNTMKEQLTHVRAENFQPQLARQIIRPLLAAGFCLAITLTISCSGDGGDENPVQTPAISSSSGGSSSSGNSSSSGGSSSSVSSSSETGCGGSDYNPATEFCYNNSKVGSKCGNNPQTYNPDLYECRDAANPNGIYLKEGLTDADGNNYDAVLIGAQTWMAKSLNYAADGSKCGDDNILSDANTSSCDTYGRLYNWTTAKTACPSGWHLPSDAEWGALMHFVSPSCSATEHCNGAGTFLKAASGWDFYEGVPFGTDDFGFAALPGGQGNSVDEFSNAGNTGYWWSASERDDSYAYNRNMYHNNEHAYRYYRSKSSLLSVRCVRD